MNSQAVTGPRPTALVAVSVASPPLGASRAVTMGPAATMRGAPCSRCHTCSDGSVSGGVCICPQRGTRCAELEAHGGTRPAECRSAGHTESPSVTATPGNTRVASSSALPGSVVPDAPTHQAARLWLAAWGRPRICHSSGVTGRPQANQGKAWSRAHGRNGGAEGPLHPPLRF